jgi:hemerythrin superfamily protein
MATTAPTRNRAPSARRSAAVQNEPRDANGRWKKTSTPSRPSRARTGGDYSTGAMVGIAAAGLAVGLAANVARKFAVQAPTALAGDWDQALAAEHAATLKLFDALEATTERNTLKRGMLLTQIKHALAKHALEEENVIYPALREAGEIDAADQLNKEHGYVKQYLYELGERPKDAPDFLDTVRRFRADLEKHMREEEQDLFPRLKLRISAEKTRELTSAVNREGLKLA